jgi:ribonuclease BN (tRNA processing enzyme)
VRLRPATRSGHIATTGQAAQLATACGARHLVLTHLWPGTDAALAKLAAGRRYDGDIDVAAAGLAVSVG